MLRPGSVACPAPARTFTTELAWAGLPQVPTSAITGWLIVIYHRRTFTGWTGSLMGCEQMNTDEHGFKGKVCFSIAQSTSRESDAPRAHSRARFLAFYLCPS